jgi:hypothetical protein
MLVRLMLVQQEFKQWWEIMVTVHRLLGFEPTLTFVPFSVFTKWHLSGPLLSIGLFICS